MSNTIEIERHALYWTIRLNRPEQLNSFNDAMHEALRSALEEAEAASDCRAVLLTGNGRGFCAGQDLSKRDPDKMDGPPDLEATLQQFYNPLIRTIRAMPKPIICAVNGVAAGAGANLALTCDIVLAARSAKFIQAFSKVGLIPDAGGSWILPRLLGEARAKALAMTAEPLPAEKAEEWGLIWRACDDDRLQSEAKALASKLAEGPTFGLGLTKAAMQAAADHSLDEHLTLEANYQGQAGRSPDYAEGVRAFFQKRLPKFTGKPS